MPRRPLPTLEELKASDAQRFSLFRKKRAPRLTTLARLIVAWWPDLKCHVERSYSSTDRAIPGARLISPGKGRHGNRLIVMDTTTPDQGRYSREGFRVILNHDGSETYRTNDEVVSWILRRVEESGIAAEGEA